MTDVFIDSCIIFNKILNEETERINKFFKDMANSDSICYINESVETECLNKVDETFNWFMDLLKIEIFPELINQIRKETRTKEDVLIKSDVNHLENAFLWKYYRPKKQGKSSFKIALKTAIRSIEYEFYSFLEYVIDNNLQIKIEEILPKFAALIDIERNKMLDNFDNFIFDPDQNIKMISEPYEELTREEVRSCKISEKDSFHIASTIHFNDNKSKAIFVTEDYGILTNKPMISWKLKLIICNPLYAKYHLN